MTDRYVLRVSNGSAAGIEHVIPAADDDEACRMSAALMLHEYDPHQVAHLHREGAGWLLGPLRDGVVARLDGSRVSGSCQR